MSNCQQHTGHSHQHGADCGHTAIEHNGHIDYLHNGCLHHPHDGHVDEHRIEVSTQNPADCTPEYECDCQKNGHIHGEGCGHEAVPHGNHIDYLVDGYLHHPHDGHCDNHGMLKVIA